MKATTWLTLLAAAVLVSGCTRMKVSSEIDPAYRFSWIRTYQWIDAPAKFMKEDAVYLDLHMQQALNNELAAKGWNQVLDAAKATIQVAYCIIIESHTEYTKTTPDRDREFSGGLVFDPGDRVWNYEERTPDQVEYMIETGTIHLLMNDTETGTLVWHAMVKTEIDRSIAPEKQSEHYQEIARKLFRELP